MNGFSYAPFLSDTHTIGSVHSLPELSRQSMDAVDPRNAISARDSRSVFMEVVRSRGAPAPHTPFLVSYQGVLDIQKEVS